MTDTKLIRQVIKDSGIKIQKIAEVMGISRYGLRNKLDGKTCFTNNEIYIFCKFLNINKALRDKIFFADVVGK